MKKIATIVFVGLLCLSTFSMFSPSAHASVSIMPTRLPHGVQGAASVYDGTNVYIFGGSYRDAPTPFNLILKYNPSTGSILAMSALLPDPVVDFPVVWTGRYAYIFGGYVAPMHTSDKIVRYDPSTDTVTVMSAKLPTYAFPVYSMSAVWDGQCAYLFGGYDGYTHLDHILKYDPTSDQITVAGARFPTGIKWNSAVWTGQYAYIFGGYTPATGVTDQIFRYDPVADTLTVVPATLPYRLGVTSAVWTGKYVYVFGGGRQEGLGYSDKIVRYDPATDGATILEETLPSPRGWTCAVWDGSNAYVFGGEDSERRDLDEILRFRPTQLGLATIDIDPNVLNLRSKGKWITAYVELPEGYDAVDINVSTIMLNDTVPAELEPTATGDYDSDGIPDLMVKFDRTAVQQYILEQADLSEHFATVALTVTGSLNDGTPFQASDTVRVVVPAMYWRAVYLEKLGIVPE